VVTCKHFRVVRLQKLMDYSVRSLVAKANHLLQLLPPDLFLLKDKANHVQIYRILLGPFLNNNLKQSLQSRFGAGGQYELAQLIIA